MKKQQIIYIPVDDIEADPDQPRIEYDAESINELAQSIREVGILEPVLVRKGKAKPWMLISGERRLRAARLAGLSEIPSIERTDFEEGDLRMSVQLIENIQREGLSDAEIGLAILQMKQKFGLKLGDIAIKLAMSRSRISRLIAAAKPGNQDDLQLCGGSANVLARFRSLPDDDRQVLREVGATISMAAIMRLESWKRSGGEITEETAAKVISGVLSPLPRGAARLEPDAPPPQRTQAQVEEESVSLMEKSSAARRQVATDGEMDLSFLRLPSSYSDTGSDQIFVESDEDDVEKTILTVSAKLTIASARVIIGKLGGDPTVPWTDVFAQFKKLLESPVVE